MSKATILLLITKADIGGAQIHVRDILAHLSQHYKFVLATGEEGFLTAQARQLGIEVRILQHLVRSINLPQDYRAYRECITLLQDVQPHLIHTHSSKAGVLGRLAAWKLGVSSLFTAHGWAFAQGAPMIQRLYGLGVESALCRLRGAVVTVSAADYKLASRFHVGAKKNRFLVRNGVAQIRRTIKRKSSNTLRIVSVGRLTENQKNQSLLIDALARLALPFEANIIGDGPSYALLKAKIETLGLAHKIKLLGEQKCVEPYLTNADIFVLSSNYEGLPLSILEAMSYGLPVVACDVGGVNEAVLHDESGLLSARGDLEGLLRNITKLANQPALREAFSERALQHYQQTFTRKRMIEEMNTVYKHVLNAD